MIDYLKASFIGMIALVVLFSPFLLSQHINQTRASEYDYYIIEQRDKEPTYLNGQVFMQTSSGQSEAEVLEGMTKEPILGPI
jgi:hypothetical protein